MKIIPSRLSVGFLFLAIALGSPRISATSPPVPSHPEQFQPLEFGRQLYDAGRFAEAAAIWQQAARHNEETGASMEAALSWSYLSLAQQELGQWEAAKEAIARSLELLRRADSLDDRGTAILAQALNTQATLQLATGDPEAALPTWQQAQNAYDRAGDPMGTLGSQINQAQALQALGLHRRSQTLLDQANEQLAQIPNSPLKATGLLNLGIALQVVGDLQQSQQRLEESLALAQQLDLDPSEILVSLGNTARTLGEVELARNYYEQGAETAMDPMAKVEAQLNQLSLLVDHQEELPDAIDCLSTLLPQIQVHLDGIPPSRTKVYARVNWADSLISIQHSQLDRQNLSFQSPDEGTIAEILATAIREARELGDPRAESYALGILGKLYEHTQQWRDAQEITQQALLVAKQVNASEIIAPWQWQLGRVLKQQEKTQEAIVAYTEAVNTLELLRRDLVAINPDLQFSFRESVEPVYRQLVSLLLTPTQPGDPIPQAYLKQARDTIEGLQLAELDNFFREACLDAQPVQIDEIDPTAAVIYPIILSDRLAVILSQGGKPLRYYETVLPQEEIEDTISQLILYLNPIFPHQEHLARSQRIYDWLLRPVEEELAASGTETLVFVLDGTLRSLPMAALHDGTQYLVEQYRIALTPGLQLLEAGALALEGSSTEASPLEALTAGITESRQDFPALPGVAFELSKIASQLAAQVLLDGEFTQTALQTQLDQAPFPVIHLATHGQFSSKVEETFLVAWDGPINVKELDGLLRHQEQNLDRPIELLVLSACQTATGDKRAALGLAGFAVRSGARSTLATLWSVQDRSTAELMVEFYRQLTQIPGTSKAEALRQAQLVLLRTPEYQHPFYWAPFVLIGNWF